MSFDVFLQRFSAGEPAEINRERVQAVLQTTKFTGPDRWGFYVVKFPDGVHVELRATGLDGTAKFTGCTFYIRGMSPYLVGFILDTAKAGDMVILPAVAEEEFVPILSSPEQGPHLPSALAQAHHKPVVCGSPAELESLLSGGFAGWKKYRDQVINGNRGL